MPEINFKIQWPDGQEESCYSPSLIVKEFFEPGEAYTVTEFLMRSRESLTLASDRVQKKYGFPCSRALGQLRRIETTIDQNYTSTPEGKVTVLAFEE